MATITALGIGSGLDANSIVDQLMSLEQQPLIKLQQKEVNYLAELSAVGQLRSAIDTFKTSVDGLKDSSDFNVYAATSADTAKFTASASSSAGVGTFDIKVNTLAAAQKQGSNSFADSDTTTVGSAGDKIKITIGSDTFSVEIGGKTLDQIAAAINDATSNVGVTASVLQKDSSNFYLTLSSDATGTANAMTLAFEDSGGSPIVDPLGMAQTQAAANAEILVDNTYTISRSSNIITDAIDGVTLTLKETSASAVKLDVTHNSGAVSNSIEGLVDAYNTLQTSISEAGASGLSGDSILRTLQNQIRSVFNTSPSGLTGDYSSLTDAGIFFEKDGSLSFNSATASAALSASLESVTELFSDDDQGYAFRLSETLDNFLDTDGLLDAKEDGINAQIDDVQDSQVSLQLRLQQVEARYRAQYAALDTLMSNLNATSGFLDQQLSILANMVPGNSNN
jgi:flagellar hook-associated protein 2